MGLIPDKPKKMKNPIVNFLLIIGPPKIGTTRALLDLPNSLHIDLQEGAIHYEGVTVNINRAARLAKLPTEGGGSRNLRNRYEALAIILEELRLKKEKDGFMYDFISLDPAGSLEEIAHDLAMTLYDTSFYKAEKEGFKVEHLKFQVGWNKGVEMIQTAFEEIVNNFRQYTNTLIMKVHGKDSYSMQNDKEVTMETLDLPKGIAGWIAKECDAIGSMYRVDNNVNKISFVKTTTNPLLGTRAEHINNKIVIISKMTDNGLETYWETIFPHIKALQAENTKQEPVKA